MSKEIAERTGAKRVPAAVTVTLWALAIGAPAMALHFNQVRAAQRETEELLLTEIARTIQSPSASREDVLAQLAMHQRQLDDTRYVRVCNRFGLAMNWNTLFAQILRRSKAEQAKAAQIIAEECGLEPGASLKREQMYLALRVLQATPVVRTLPILGPATPSLN